MSLTLFETFRQIDPYVKFTDGTHTLPVHRLLMCVDPMDPTEYVLGLDELSRILIFRLDVRGRAISPPVFIEEKAKPATPPNPLLGDFGNLLHGYV